jgi:hypothetical protein
MPGLPFALHPGYELIDFVAPKKIILNNTTKYGCVFVLFKSWLDLAPGDAKNIYIYT